MPFLNVASVINYLVLKVQNFKIVQYNISLRMERRRSQKSQLRANVSEQSVVLDSGARVPESEVGAVHCTVHCIVHCTVHCTDHCTVHCTVH